MSALFSPVSRFLVVESPSKLPTPWPAVLWAIRFLVANAPTVEALHAAITEVQRTTGRRIREVRKAGLEAEAAYWEEIRDHQLDTLRSWSSPGPPRSRRGRPKGSGRYFSTREEFVAALRRAMQHVHQYDPPISKPKVAAVFHRTPGGVRTSVRQLYTWLHDFDVSWDEIRSSIQP